MVAVLAAAYAKHGTAIDAETIETIGRECLKKHLNAEIARHEHRARGG